MIRTRETINLTASWAETGTSSSVSSLCKRLNDRSQSSKFLICGRTLGMLKKGCTSGGTALSIVDCHVTVGFAFIR